jgi:hypothetical protein
MTNLIKLIDIFGSQPSLYVEQNKKKQSYLGGITSLIIYFITLIGAIFFGQEIRLKQNPITNSETTYNDKPTKINYFDDFALYLGMENNSNIYYDDTIYKIEGFLMTYNATEKITAFAPLEVEKCGINSFGKEILDVFKDTQFENGHCVKKNHKNSENLTIAGIYGNPGFSSVLMRIRQCNNDTDNNICAPQAVIDKTLASANIVVRAIDNWVTTKNFTTPFHKGTKEYFQKVSVSSFLGSVLYLREVDVISDVGLVFEDKQPIKGFIHNNMYYNPSNTKQKYFTQISVQMITTKDTYYKSYMKLQTLAAQIGGLIKFVTLCASLLLYFYSKNDYAICLVNSIFYFKDNKNNNNKENRTLKKIFSQTLEDETLNKQNTIQNTNKHCIKINNFQDPLKEKPETTPIRDLFDNKVIPQNLQRTPHNLKKKESINFSFMEKFFLLDLCIFSRRGRSKLDNSWFLNEFSFIKERLDVRKLLGVYSDVDKLKYLWMGERERRFFDILNIPFENENLSEEKEKFRIYMKTNNKVSLDDSHFYGDDNINLTGLERRILNLLH